MTAPNNSEITGTLQEYSFADLLAETSQAKLSGSFRLNHLDEKAVVYLQEGKVVFAVSNLRQHRLFQILLQTQTITKEVLTEITNFTNDFELAENLVANGNLTREMINLLFAGQIEQIIRGILQWETGAWAFSHLARAKETMRFQIDTSKILVEFVRQKSEDEISRKFRSIEEKFVARGGFRADLSLRSEEGYLFSRFDSTPLKLQDIKTHSGMPVLLTLKVLYLLWVGEFISRHNWQSAFSENKVKELLSAKLTLKTPLVQSTAKVETNAPADEEVVELELDGHEPDEKELLTQYLTRVESAESYYEILEVSIKAAVPEIKAAYFKLAKNYHPDKFHNEVDSQLQQKVQNAFTEIARAYETLKDEKARELYDFKLRKYLESVKEQEKSSTPGAPQVKVEPDRAKGEFDQGFDCIMNQDYENAIPFLARAVQMSPDNARYHAYYGKALSFAKNQRFKAETEINTAIKLEADNPAHRIMLVEFYIQFNLLKRAEGELSRLLAAFPGNKEAQVLLDSLAK
jgi:curved DNA-binding protein CbpA